LTINVKNCHNARRRCIVTMLTVYVGGETTNIILMHVRRKAKLI